MTTGAVQAVELFMMLLLYGAVRSFQTSRMKEYRRRKRVK